MLFGVTAPTERLQVADVVLLTLRNRSDVMNVKRLLRSAAFPALMIVSPEYPLSPVGPIVRMAPSSHGTA